MKTFLKQLRGAVMSTLVFAVVCCGIYPVIIWGIAQLAFPHAANGSLITDAQGTVRGSELLGQSFTADKYFHSRPSAAGNGYDAVNSGGSNLGPTSKKLSDGIAQNISDYRSQNGLSTNESVPADAVTASASGLDPHISQRNAELQLKRVAQARHLPPERITALVRDCTDNPSVSFLGQPGVNVLKLNLALDAL